MSNSNLSRRTGPPGTRRRTDSGHGETSGHRSALRSGGHTGQGSRTEGKGADLEERPAGPRPPRGASIIAEVQNLDRELIRLIAKRSRLLAKLPARQPGSGNADNERDLRLSWERNASRVSRDPRLIRQVFALLREVEVLASDMDHGAAFNLAPALRPVQVDLPAPVSDRRIRAALVLAAAAGSSVKFSGVPLGNAVMECLKMLNQTGANLHWEEEGRILCNLPWKKADGLTISRPASPIAGFHAGRPGTALDRVIHVGDDPLNLYLLIFLMTTRPTRLKLVGEGGLKLANLAPLRHFLPRVGARLTAVVPGREGLPARLETSALLPSAIEVPAGLPADALFALCLGLAFYNSPCTVTTDGNAGAANVFAEVAPLLRAAGVGVEMEADRLRVTPGHIMFGDGPALEPYLPGTAFFLALPAFAGGEARLRGAVHPDESGPERTLLAAMCSLLEGAGLSLDKEADALVARQSPDRSAHLVLKDLPDDFLPLGLALALIPVVRHNGGRLPVLPAGYDPVLLDDFLLRFGFARKLPEEGEAAEGDGWELIAVPDGIPVAPWTAPTPSWALALALGAFLRPHLKLGNPGIVSARMPDFWTLYNSLPVPEVRPEAPHLSPETARPARRRFFADHMPESERPEPLPYEDE